jgi:hypothetical protein
MGGGSCASLGVKQNQELSEFRGNGRVGDSLFAGLRHSASSSLLVPWHGCFVGDLRRAAL